MVVSRRGCAALALVVSGLVGASALAAETDGTRGADVLVGTPKADRIAALGGADRIKGLAGPDRLLGGRGNDLIRAGTGFDEVAAGSGDDTVRARDGRSDSIECGRGRDTAFVDKVEDGVYDCEVVKEP